MKIGDRIRILYMPEDKREFKGREGVVTSCRAGSPFIGVKLDGDFRIFPLMCCQVIKVKQ